MPCLEEVVYGDGREETFSDPTSMDDPFVRAYHDFRNSVDLTKCGVLPDLNNLIWYMLMGIPRVPADEDLSEEAPYIAIDQRVTILKAVFVEVNRNENEAFLDEGLQLYDRASQMAKSMLEETSDH